MRSKNGFTLVELMLAMAFLSLLLIAIATTAMYMSRLFDKGQTLKQVNQSGREVSDAIRRDARAASGLTEYWVRPNAPDNPTRLGRMCFGSVSYVWNEASRLQANVGVRYGNNPGAPQVILARMNDPGGEFCRKNASGVYPTAVPASATEMLNTDGRDLAIYALSFEPLINVAGTQMMYTLRFTLGTNETGTIDTASASCRAPDDAQSDFNFCAVNNFEQVIYVR